MADIRCRKQQKQPGGAEGGYFKRASPAILPAGPRVYEPGHIVLLRAPIPVGRCEIAIEGVADA